MNHPGHNNIERAARDPYYRQLYEIDRARHESNKRFQKLKEEGGRGAGKGGGSTRSSAGLGRLILPLIMAALVYGGWQIVTGDIAADKGTGFWLLVIGVIYFVVKIRRLARS